MAKRTNNQTPVPEEFREQFKTRYFVCYLDWRPILSALTSADDYRAVIEAAFEYAETGNTPDLKGVPLIVFLSLKKDIDKDLEHAVQRGWKAQQAQDSRTRARTPADGRAPAITPNTEHLTHNTQHITHNTQPPTTPTRTGAVGGGIGNDPADSVNLRDYLTEDQEGSLLNAIFYAGGLVAGVLEHFVLSTDYNPSDDHDTMEAKLLDFKRRYEDELDRKETEDRKLREEELRQERLANTSPAPRPRSLQELRAFCLDTGNKFFDCESLWEEMEASDWKITDRKSGAIRPLADWHKFVLYRISKAAD
jgi:hypothetical protein